MCEPASMVVIKENGGYQVFWSKNSDSHEVIKEENSLEKLDVENVRGDYRMIPVEITPPDNDFRLPLDQWKFRAEVTPEWANLEDVEVACRIALKDWLAANVILPEQVVDEANKYYAAICGTVNHITGGTVNYIRGGTVNDITGGTVNYITGGTVNDIRGGTVNYYRGKIPTKITGHTTIINYGSLTPDILKSSKAVMIDRSSNTIKCFIGTD